MDGINWPTILGKLRHELAPAMALILTDRHLVTLADEPSRSWFVNDDHVNVGVVVTYLPRRRISDFAIEKHNRFHILQIEVSTAYGHERVTLRFPPEYQGKAIQLANRAPLNGTQDATTANGESPMKPKASAKELKHSAVRSGVTAPQPCSRIR